MIDDYDAGEQNSWLREKFERVKIAAFESDRATTKALAMTPYRFGRSSGSLEDETLSQLPRYAPRTENICRLDCSKTGSIVEQMLRAL